MIAGTNSLDFAWPPPESEIVARYEIAAAYVGDCPEIASSFPDGSATDFQPTMFQFAELQEFSNYSLSVTAVNDAGSSETSTLVATTLSAGESLTHRDAVACTYIHKYFALIQLPAAQYRA